MIPQTYPLFYGRPEGDELRTGRIIGWRQDADGDPPRPVVLVHNPDGTAGGVREVTLDGSTPCWVRDSENDLAAAFELHQKLHRIQDLTQ